jgi:UDP-N-acetylmuramoyl-tripeptide--D-alanyl-D-alanine ligase
VPALRLAELAEGTGGTLLSGDPSVVVRSYDIDTRRLAPGGVFFALVGEHSDGHQHVEKAARAGAAAAVIHRELDAAAQEQLALIRVDDTQAALSRIARWIRKNSRETRWIAVTGSNGKTTSKEMIAEGLAAKRRVHRTPGNFNNHLGVPLTLLAMPEDTEFAVVELAMSGAGEIADLTRIVDPDVAMVTNVRAVHMAAFRTLDDVAAAKGELFALLRDEAWAVVNLDDPNVRVQAARHVGPRVTFGRNPAADLCLEKIDNSFVPGAALTLRQGNRVRRLQLRMGGAHSAYNALAALATIVAAGEDADAAAERIANLQAGPGRGRAHRLGGDILLVDDSYNSSPPALASVLETLRASDPPGRRVLVMGDMLELGPMEAALHREAGRRIATAGVELLVTVGSLSREASDAARKAGVPLLHHFADSGQAADALGEMIRPGDLIVVKGSRRIRLGRVVRALTAAFEEVH